MTFVSDNSITIAATSSAITSILVGYPFDSLKTRMQAYKFPSTYSCLTNTFKNEGLLGFYRGVLPLLVTSTSLRAIGWNLYISSKTSLQNKFKVHGYGDGLFGVVVPCSIAGMGTGFVSSLLAAPIEFIKVQRQLQKVYTPSQLSSLQAPQPSQTHIPGSSSSPPKISKIPFQSQPASKNLFGWFRHVINQKGLGGLYTGYRYHAPMDIFGTGVYFAIYESFKYHGPKNSDGSPLPWVSVGGGGLAGALSWIVVFPIDVVKSMVQKEGLREIPKTASVLISGRFQEFGIRGFYRGLSMQLIRSVPVHSLNFYVFETVVSWCKNKQ